MQVTAARHEWPCGLKPTFLFEKFDGFSTLTSDTIILDTRNYKSHYFASYPWHSGPDLNENLVDCWIWKLVSPSTDSVRDVRWWLASNMCLKLQNIMPFCNQISYVLIILTCMTAIQFPRLQDTIMKWIEIETSSLSSLCLCRRPSPGTIVHARQGSMVWVALDRISLTPGRMDEILTIHLYILCRSILQVWYHFCCTCATLNQASWAEWANPIHCAWCQLEWEVRTLPWCADACVWSVLYVIWCTVFPLCWRLGCIWWLGYGFV